MMSAGKPGREKQVIGFILIATTIMHAIAYACCTSQSIQELKRVNGLYPFDRKSARDFFLDDVAGNGTRDKGILRPLRP